MKLRRDPRAIDPICLGSESREDFSGREVIEVRLVRQEKYQCEVKWVIRYRMQ